MCKQLHPSFRYVQQVRATQPLHTASHAEPQPEVPEAPASGARSAGLRERGADPGWSLTEVFMPSAMTGPLSSP
jgi:hypothetical protein